MQKECDILIIDDEMVVLDAVSKICAAHGYGVSTAMDGASALRKLDQVAYRLIICDIMMPEVDGFHILEVVRGGHPLTAVIMTTGYSTIEHAVRSLGSGAMGYLPKPFTEKELVSAIKRGLRYAELEVKSRFGEDPENTSARNEIGGEGSSYRLGWISWVRIEKAGSAVVGVTENFLKTIAPVKHIALMSVSDEVVQGTSCAQITCTDDCTHDVLG
ncbi:MAG: response regulator, partial [Ignavibacteria bacterium]|nr:response regulator [Ignavibacteria bacterium]